MDRRMLVPRETTPYDAAIPSRVRMPARPCGSSLLLIQMADSIAAPYQSQRDPLVRGQATGEVRAVNAGRPTA